MFSIKKGEVDEALEKYGFAGVFLTCLEVKKEDDKVAFFTLASNIILNMAMCFLKKKEFLQRALAAIELGRHDLAIWDLSLASEVEPSNQEVEKKLNHVKNLLHNPSIELALDTCSVDLDLNPSLPRNPSVGRILKEKGNHVVDCEVGARKEEKEEEALPKSNKRGLKYWKGEPNGQSWPWNEGFSDGGSNEP
ncbi:Sperm-associated antigen 1A [Bienertia sinuspersici]